MFLQKQEAGSRSRSDRRFARVRRSLARRALLAAICVQKRHHFSLTPLVHSLITMKTSLLNSFAVRCFVAALMLATAQLAHAHARPTHQAPAAGSTVTTSQKEVAIDFDDSLEPAFSLITVTDAQGKSVTSDKAVVDPSSTKHMSVALNALTPGVYAVAWVAVAADGHRTQGHYTFTVK